MPLEIDIERAALPSLLKRGDLVGIELGVASGDYSFQLYRSGLFSRLYGVDIYCDHHDVNEYKKALKLIGLESKYKLLRMSFDDALDLFEDETFDFIYIDGYAHTGENAGKTLFDWYAKVKPGGLICGHDYHPDWPLVVAAVDELAVAAELEVSITRTTTEISGYQDFHPSWAAFKRKPHISYTETIRDTVLAAGPDPEAYKFDGGARSGD